MFKSAEEWMVGCCASICMCLCWISPFLTLLHIWLACLLIIEWMWKRKHILWTQIVLSPVLNEDGKPHALHMNVLSPDCSNEYGRANTCFAPKLLSCHLLEWRWKTTCLALNALRSACLPATMQRRLHQIWHSFFFLLKDSGADEYVEEPTDDDAEELMMMMMLMWRSCCCCWWWWWWWGGGDVAAGHHGGSSCRE